MFIYIYIHTYHRLVSPSLSDGKAPLRMARGVYLYVYMYMYVYIYVDIYINKYSYTHIYVYKYIYMYITDLFHPLSCALPQVNLGLTLTLFHPFLFPSRWKGTSSDGTGRPEVHGLTTATSVWLAAAVGILNGGAIYVAIAFSLFSIACSLALSISLSLSIPLYNNVFTCIHIRIYIIY